VRPWQRGLWCAGAVAAVAAFALSAGGCRCNANATCETRQAGADLAIHLNPAGLRPEGVPKVIRVLGSRTDTDICFELGSQNSFLTTLQEPATLDLNTPRLQHGSWQINANALSGGDYKPVIVNHTFAAGSTNTMQVGADEAHNLVITF